MNQFQSTKAKVTQPVMDSHEWDEMGNRGTVRNPRWNTVKSDNLEQSTEHRLLDCTPNVIGGVDDYFKEQPIGTLVPMTLGDFEEAMRRLQAPKPVYPVLVPSNTPVWVFKKLREEGIPFKVEGDLR